MNAADRVRQRVREWLTTQGRGGRKLLTRAVAGNYGKPMSPSWATGISKPKGAKGAQDLRLADLDDVADLLGVPPGELVRQPDKIYMELTMAEARLVQYYRSMPETVRHGWLSWLDYLFRFQQSALGEQGRERQTKTARARKQENPAARQKVV